MPTPRLSALSEWARPRLPGLVDDAYKAILQRMPLFSREEPVPHRDLRESVEHNLKFVLAALERPIGFVDATAPQETGRRRAVQGVPLPEVLRTYRISFTTLWEDMLTGSVGGRRPLSTEGLLAAASRIWEATDQHAMLLTEAYRSASAELLVSKQRRRSALVEALLTGHPGADGGPWEAAALLNLTPDADLVVVAAQARGLADDALPGIEGALAGLGIVSGWRLTPSLLLGVVSLGPDQHQDLLKVLRATAVSRTGVSPPYRSLADTPRALRLARVALSLVPAGRAEVHVFDPSPLAALVAHEPGEAKRLADEVFGGVVALDAGSRTSLVDTLVAYVEHGGSAERAGHALGCHANTVRYRLRRLEEMTGRSVSEPRGIAELASAVVALEFLGGPRPAEARPTGSPPPEERS